MTIDTYEFSQYSRSNNLEATVPFGKEFVQIRANPDDFRRNMVQDSQRQGLDPLTTSDFARTISFAIDDIQDYIAQKAKGSTFFASTLKKLDSIIPAIHYPVGVVIPHQDGSVDCLIDVKDIVQRVEQQKAIPNFSIPSDI